MATNPFGMGIDPLASYRQTMETAREVMDPMAEVRRYREQTKPVDPFASYRQTMETARKVMDPMAEVRRYREQTKPVDPFASYRQTMETARKVLDPMGEYRRIMSEFSRLTGAPSPPAEEEPFSAVPSPLAPPATFFSPALILVLLSVAWTCGGLIVRGADTQTFGDLLFDAVSLAAYFYEQSRQTGR